MMAKLPIFVFLVPLACSTAVAQKDLVSLVQHSLQILHEKTIEKPENNTMPTPEPNPWGDSQILIRWKPPIPVTVNQNLLMIRVGSSIQGSMSSATSKLIPDMVADSIDELGRMMETWFQQFDFVDFLAKKDVLPLADYDLRFIHSRKDTISDIAAVSFMVTQIMQVLELAERKFFEISMLMKDACIGILNKLSKMGWADQAPRLTNVLDESTVYQDKLHDSLVECITWLKTAGAPLEEAAYVIMPLGNALEHLKVLQAGVKGEDLFELKAFFRELRNTAQVKAEESNILEDAYGKQMLTAFDFLVNQTDRFQTKRRDLLLHSTDPAEYFMQKAYTFIGGAVGAHSFSVMVSALSVAVVGLVMA